MPQFRLQLTPEVLQLGVGLDQEAGEVGVQAPIHVMGARTTLGPDPLPLAEVVVEVTGGQDVVVTNVGDGSADALHGDVGVECAVRVAPEEMAGESQ